MRCFVCAIGNVRATLESPINYWEAREPPVHDRQMKYHTVFIVLSTQIHPANFLCEKKYIFFYFSWIKAVYYL
jgi:hypothetical protein